VMAVDFKQGLDTHSEIMNAKTCVKDPPFTMLFL